MTHTPFDLPIDYLLGMAGWLAAGCVAFFVLLHKRRNWARLKSPRIFWANLGLSVWMFLAALTAVELYFAIVFDQTDSFNMSNVSQHWFRRHVRTNAQGYRDARPLKKNPPAGARQIFFVGDSFTFGHGVKDVADRFSDRVGAQLNAERPGKFVVSNIGECGIHVQLVSNIVKTVVDFGYHPDVLVYTLCLNDIEGFDESKTGMQERFDLLSPKFSLFRDTYFLNMLYFRVQQARVPEVRSYYADLAQFYRGSAWDRMRAALDDLHEFCRAHHIDLRIAIFPFLHNLGPDYPFKEGHERIAEYCRSAGIPCVDLEPVLLPHVGEGLTVNRFDAHPNERAHALAAEAIEKNLLPDLFERDRG